MITNEELKNGTKRGGVSEFDLRCEIGHWKARAEKAERDLEKMKAAHGCKGRCLGEKK